MPSGKERNITAEGEQFVKDNYLNMSQKELAAALKCGEGTISGAMRRLGLTVPKDIVNARKTKALTGKTTSTPEIDAVITKHYLDKPFNELARLTQKSDTFIKKRMQQLGLIIPPEVMEARIKQYQRKPGDAPPNKGRKQSEYMTPEQIERTKATRFKKGEPNHNTLYDGAITIRHEHPDRKGGRPYKYIRLSKSVWKQLHIYNWEAVNGPVPEGYILVSRDGDSLNCEPDNWEAITLNENMKRNSGAVHLPDGMVALYLAGGKNYDKEFRDELLKHPELIELKRKQLLLKRQINERRNTKANGTNEG